MKNPATGIYQKPNGEKDLYAKDAAMIKVVRDRENIHNSVIDAIEQNQ